MVVLPSLIVPPHTTLWNFVDYVLLFVIPVAVTTYEWLDIKVEYLTRARAVVVLPLGLLIFVAMVFLVYIPHQYLTTIGLAFELSVVTVMAVVNDYPGIHECVFVLCFSLLDLSQGPFTSWNPCLPHMPCGS
jgi:hypothetical protein